MHFNVLIQVYEMLKRAHLRSKLLCMEIFTGKLQSGTEKERERRKEGERGKRRGKREKCGRHRGKKGVRKGRRSNRREEESWGVRLLDVNFGFAWHLLSEQQWYLVCSDKSISFLLTFELI